MRIRFKYIFAALVSVLVITFSITPVLGATNSAIEFFYSPTCPHCANAKIFLTDLQHEFPDIVIRQHEVSSNIDILAQFYEEYNVPTSSHGFVPAIFIGTQYFVGFNAETAQEIRKIVGGTSGSVTSKNNAEIAGIDTSILALPLVAILLGALDGFNICSLGALLIILSLVLALKSRRRILLYGGTFIITTSVIYGLLIFFWYQLFNTLAPYLRKLEILIAILTIGGGIYFLREFLKFRKSGPTCGVGPAQKIEGGFAKKFQKLVDGDARTIPILISIVAFAAVITIVEFPCSAAVPVAFAGMLTKAQLPSLLYGAYITLYVLFYMLDELLVFLIAFFTMRLWLTSPKFVTWITLVESVVLFALGAYYLFGLV